MDNDFEAKMEEMKREERLALEREKFRRDLERECEDEFDKNRQRATELNNEAVDLWEKQKEVGLGVLDLLEKALRLNQNSEEIKKNYAKGLKTYAIQQEMERNYRGAIEHYNHALSISTSRILRNDILWGLGSSYLRIQQYEDACENLREASVDRSEPEIDRCLATAICGMARRQGVFSKEETREFMDCFKNGYLMRPIGGILADPDGDFEFILKYITEENKEESCVDRFFKIWSSKPELKQILEVARKEAEKKFTGLNKLREYILRKEETDCRYDFIINLLVF